jgi:hypothetical protein
MDEMDWDTAPITVEGLLEALGKQAIWEARTGLKSPGIMITSRMFAETAARILVLEEKVNALVAFFAEEGGLDE